MQAASLPKEQCKEDCLFFSPFGLVFKKKTDEIFYAVREALPPRAQDLREEKHQKHCRPPCSM